MKDIRCEADIPETADTLEGNAALKAEYIHAHYGMDCFADDTGLEVEALDGAPGVYSARYAGGEGHDSEANMKKLLAELEGKENRKAQFRTAICLIEGGEKHLFEGIVKGEIIREKKEAPAEIQRKLLNILRKAKKAPADADVSSEEPVKTETVRADAPGFRGRRIFFRERRFDAAPDDSTTVTVEEITE